MEISKYTRSVMTGKVLTNKEIKNERQHQQDVRKSNNKLHAKAIAVGQLYA
jgi:hypothetical protein